MMKLRSLFLMMVVVLVALALSTPINVIANTSWNVKQTGSQVCTYCYCNGILVSTECEPKSTF